MAIVRAPAAPPAAPAALSRAALVLASPRRTLCLAVVVLAGVVGLDALSDPDVWWHMLLGSWMLQHGSVVQTEMLSYTAAGSTLAPHEWLSGVLFSAVSSAGGLFLLALLMGAVSWSGFIAIALRGRMRAAGPMTIALWLALAAKAAEPVLGTRPQVFTFAFLAVTVGLVERHLRRGGRLIWALPPLFLLWANLHGGFVAGLAFMTLIWGVELSRAVFHRGTPVAAARIRELALVTIVCALAACLNPAGAGAYGFALSETTSEGAKGIIEWQRPNFTDPSMWPLLAVLVGVFVLGRAALRARRLALRDAVVAATACAAAVLAVRNASVCVAVVTPMCMEWTADLMRARAARRAAARPGTAASVRPPAPVTPVAVAAGALLLAGACAALGVAVVRVQASASPAGIAAAYPACATTVLQRAPAGQRIFTAYGDGGFVAAQLWPRDQVYIYGASDAFTTTQFTAYYRIASAATSAPTALQLLHTSGTTAVLFPSGRLTAQLAHTTGWTHVLADHGMQLFVRGDAAWAAGAAC